MKRGNYAKGHARRAQITAVALELFGQRGFRGVSLREMAAAAGVTHPTLLHYFPTKNELLMAVLREWDSAAEDLIERASGPRDLPRFNRAVNEANAAVPGVVALFTTTVAEAVDPSHSAHDYYQQRYRDGVATLTGLFEQARREGLLRNGVDPKIAAQTLFALQDGAQIQWLFDPSNINVADLSETYLRSVLDETQELDPHW